MGRRVLGEGGGGVAAGGPAGAHEMVQQRTRGEPDRSPARVGDFKVTTWIIFLGYSSQALWLTEHGSQPFSWVSRKISP